MSEIINVGIRLDASGLVQGVTVGEQQFNRIEQSARRAQESTALVDKAFDGLKGQLLAFASIGTAIQVFRQWNQAVMDGAPKSVFSKRSTALGFPASNNIHEIVREYQETTVPHHG